MDNELHRGLLAMKNRTVVLGKIAVARGALELPPGAATGMAVGPQVVQPQPTAIVTIGVGTKMPRGVHRPGAAVRARHGSGPDRRRWIGLPGLLFTHHTVRLVRQALERFGLGRTLAFGLDRHGWGGQAWLGPRERQHNEEPDDRQQSELVVKKMRDHGIAPFKVW